MFKPFLILILLWGLFLGEFSHSAIQRLETRAYCSSNDSACSIGKFNFGVGVGWSRYSNTSVFLPQLELQYAFLNHFAVSISGGGLNAGTVYPTKAAIPSIVFGTGLHYYSRESFRGFWFQAAFAEYLFKLAGSEQSYAPQSAVLSTVGWRWRPQDVSGSFGFGIGAQRLFIRNATIEPVLRTDIAVDFNADSLFY